ncbi:glutathione S-transferase [Fusarium phyllophilum]|uniref:glutathione transferase n=1 Tax=Fusarium phyllophilum TaxID=47803 RepID=A0A8H5MQK0_9HYPO|nr:glutathione S-transferase [Fusarium phyllophilum]
MALKLYGHPQSICTKRVRTVLEEKKLQYEFIVVDFLKGEHLSEPYGVKFHPFKKIPVLVDEEADVKVFGKMNFQSWRCRETNSLFPESRAISYYIAAKYRGSGPDLSPSDTYITAYASFQQGLSIKLSYFDVNVSIIAWEAIFKPVLGHGAGDEATIKAKLGTLDADFAGYEHILSRQSYLAGDETTLADIFHLPYGSLVKQAGFEGLLLKYPSVQAWWKRLEERESWKKVNASEE